MTKTPKFIFVISLLFFYTSTFAQKKEVGFKAGAGYARSRAIGWVQKFHEPTIGFSAGFNGNLWIHHDWYLSGAILFERTGARFNDIIFTDFSGNNILAKLHAFNYFDHITIPVTINYSFGAKNRFSLGAGMFAGYLVGANFINKVDSGQYDLPKKTSIKKDYKDFNYGVCFNAGYRVPLRKNKTLAFALEDHLGLNNIDDISNGGKLKTHLLALYLNFLIPLK